MVDPQELLQALPIYTGKAILIEREQGVKDIINEILQAHANFSAHYDAIAPFFDDGSDFRTIAKNIFDFCKKNIRYTIEPDERQTTKSPAAILAQASGDCKHYASFIGGLIDAISRRRQSRVNWCYRFASYNLFDKSPQHVFIVLKTAGAETWVDPVLTSFNNRKQYFFKIDKIPVMSLYRVSGTPAVGSFLSNIWHGVKAVAASAPRNAFLALVRLNVHGFATNLLSQDQAKVKDKWERTLGGSYSALLSAMKAGASKKAIFGVVQVRGVAGIGRSIGEPVTTVSLLTAAAGIIAALGSLLKALPGTPESTDDTIDDIIKQSEDLAAQQQQEEEQKAPDITKYLLIGGAGLVAYMLIKKK